MKRKRKKKLLKNKKNIRSNGINKNDTCGVWNAAGVFFYVHGIRAQIEFTASREEHTYEI